MVYTNRHKKIIFYYIYSCIFSLITQSTILIKPACPCNPSYLCNPVKLIDKCMNNDNIKDHEIYVFSPDSYNKSLNGKIWKYYDWNLTTTIAWNKDKEMMCYAHLNCVKIHILKNFNNIESICDSGERQKWIKNVVNEIRLNYADGVNIDTESVLTSAQSACQTMLLKELREEFNSNQNTSIYEIVFDVPWAPHGIDQRFYDWKGIAKYSDSLFVMSYDMQSQLYSSCIAQANSPLDLINAGLQEYIMLGIDSKMLILGVPWYGYIYSCNTLSKGIEKDYCEIKQTSFRGAPCSDAAGNQISYKNIKQLIKQYNITTKWDDLTKSSWFNIYTSNGDQQVWYDNVKSTKLKTKLAEHLCLKGMGTWNAELLDYTQEPEIEHETNRMWDALTFRSDNCIYSDIKGPINIGPIISDK